MIKLQRVQALAILDHDCVADVAHDRRIGEDLTDTLRVLSLITGFFSQFASARRFGGRVGCIHHASRDFQLDGVRAMAILLHHHQLIFGRERNNIDPIDAINDEEIVFALRARRNLPVGADRKDAEIANRPGTDFFPRLNHFT